MAQGVDLSDAKDLSSEGLPHIITWAGMPDDEDNCCAIIALAIVTDLPFNRIQSLAKACLGREPKEPTMNMKLACKYLPFKIRKVSKKRFRFHTLIDRYPNGKYFVQVGGKNTPYSIGGMNLIYRNHSLALVDGRIYDTLITSPDRWVNGVWRIDGLKSQYWWGWKQLALNTPAPGHQ